MKPDILFIVIGMSVVTYIPRWLPLFLFRAVPCPPGSKNGWILFLQRFSSADPPRHPDGGDPRHLDLFKPEFWVTIPTLWVAFMTRSLAGTVITGMGLFWLFSNIFR